MFAVTVNNVPVQAYAVYANHQWTTYVDAQTAMSLLGINVVLTGNEVSAPFENVQGTVIDGIVCVPWNEIAVGVHAAHIPSGWNFYTVPGVIADTPMLLLGDAIYFGAKDGSAYGNFQLDTGAYEPLINPETAALWDLPNLSPAPIYGVGGAVSNAYNSMIPSLTIGNSTFINIPCVVDPAWQRPSLFGYKFFVDNQYGLYVDPNNFTIDITHE